MVADTPHDRTRFLVNDLLAAALEIDQPTDMQSIRLASLRAMLRHRGAHEPPFGVAAEVWVRLVTIGDRFCAEAATPETRAVLAAQLADDCRAVLGALPNPSFDEPRNRFAERKDIFG